MALANGWLIARPAEDEEGRRLPGETVLYIEHTERRGSNLPKRPNDGSVRETVDAGWFDVPMSGFGSQPWYQHRLDIDRVVVLDDWKPATCRYLFDGLQNCKSFDLLRLDTSESTSFEGMFRGCTSVRELFDLDRLDTTHVTSTSHMFLNCLSLRAVSISGWDTSGIKDVDYMLAGCSTYVLASEGQGDFLTRIARSGDSGIWRRSVQ